MVSKLNEYRKHGLDDEYGYPDTDFLDIDFDTFEEMKDCYWWTSQDIKEEVDFYLKEATNGDACIGDDGADVYYHGTDMMISYRKFSAMWRKELKNM